MPRNDAAAPGHVCPGIRIHVITIVQPPGTGISPIADMDAHQTIVSAALPAKSSAETPKKALSEARSETMRTDVIEFPYSIRRRSATNSAGNTATAADLSGPIPAKCAGTLKESEFWPLIPRSNRSDH